MLEKEYSAKAKEYYAHERQEMLKYIPGTVKYVLDIGCSSGAFGYAVKKKFNCEVWGIEPDTRAAANSSLLLDKVYNSIFSEEIDLCNQKFDCIIFNDVLEHLVSPFEAIQICKKYLSKNGVLVCSIPNLRYFDAIYHIIVGKDFKYVESGIFDKTHLRFFTKRSIERMFLESEYKIELIEGINSIKEVNKKGYRNFRFLNLISFNSIADMEFQQFAVVVKL